jgi:hypothetical protein
MSPLTRHVIVVLAAFAGLWSAWPAQAATSTTFSGRATVLQGKVLGIQLPCAGSPTAPPSDCRGVVDTGPVAAEGGALDATLLCYPDQPGCVVGLPDLTNGALGARVLHAATVAGGNNSRAEASVASVGVNAAGQSVSATFLMARASASCTDSKASVSGSAEVVDLVVNGQTIAVTGQVNQRVDLPGGGVVILNEQVASVHDGHGDITVNALHIVIPGLLPGTDTDVVVAQAHADINCAPPGPKCPSTRDFVTGGGWIVTDAGARASLAVAGGIKNGFWGHLTYIDHGTGMKVKGTGVTAYTVLPGTLRHIEGTAEVNGASGYTYKADVADNGEPGRGVDTFSLTLTGPTPYSTGAKKLSGGNIQLHNPCV